jgi:DNA polymerase III delta prime subunit
MPTTLAELCLTKTNRKMLEEFVKTKSVPHMILYGRAGIGKTTLYHVLKNELGATGELYNGSKDRSINVLRDEITEILSKVTFSDTYDKRICAIDEFENISKDFMLALKGTIDDCDSNATFMFMTNTLSNVIDPILDRCELISLVPNSGFVSS